MKKFLVLFLLVAAAALATAAAVSADATGDSTGAPCSDIVTGNVAYHVIDPDTGLPTVNTVDGTVQYNDLTCRNVTYALVITYTSGGQTVVRADFHHGNASTDTLSFAFTNVVSDTGTVCVAALTFTGARLYDRSPDTGCVTITADSSGGGGVPPI